DSNSDVYAVFGQGTASVGSGLERVSYALNRSIDGGQTWQYTTTTGTTGGLAVDTGTSAQIGSSFGGKNELRGNITAVASDATSSHVYVVYGKRDASSIDRLWMAEFHTSGTNLVERASPVAFSPAGETA